MSAIQKQKHSDKRIGLVAGWGRFPVYLAQVLRKQGFQVYCVGVLDHADPVLADICTEYRVIGIGKMGGAARWFRRKGVGRATMAGKIFKTRLFNGMLRSFQHLPDLACLRHFYPLFITNTKDRRDDTLLTTVTRLFAEGGVEFAPATEFAPELLVKQGTLTDKCLTGDQWKDVRFGWNMAKEMGRLDIGQTVVIKNQAVMAVEAIEGTDECIKRAGKLCKGGFTVVKVAKPEQDMRFDVPTIGVGTIETIHRAGGAVLAIEADKTIFLDRMDTVALANRLGVRIISVDPAEFKIQRQAA